MGLRRDESGNRVVGLGTAVKTTLGATLATAVSAIAILNWLGVPSPAEYRRHQEEIRVELTGIKEQMADTNRILRLYGITDEDAAERMRRERVGG